MIEKFKALDKKAQIGIGVGVAAVVIIIIAVIVIALSDKPAGGKNNGTETETGNVTETFGTEKGTENVTEVFGTELETELGTEIETEMGTETEMTESESESESQSQSQTQGVGGTTVTKPESVGGVEQKPITTTPEGEEILGLGSASQPYEVIPNLDTMTVTTVAVPANSTLYYSIQRVGGMWLTINDSAAYVIEKNGTRHNASNGEVAFTVESALASEYVTLQIGNSSSSAKSFTIKFSNIRGTYQNPEKVTTVGTFQKSLSAGNEIGYYYKYYAEQTGTLKFYVTGTKASGISVTNNRNSANRTTDADSKTDQNGRQYVELEVNAGDEILILIHANPDGKGRYPATNITWEMQY